MENLISILLISITIIMMFMQIRILFMIDRLMNDKYEFLSIDMLNKFRDKKENDLNNNFKKA